jgi:hypothetical protein
MHYQIATDAMKKLDNAHGMCHALLQTAQLEVKRGNQDKAKVIILYCAKCDV